jgi:hypothetical protein
MSFSFLVSLLYYPFRFSISNPYTNNSKNDENYIVIEKDSDNKISEEVNILEYSNISESSYLVESINNSKEFTESKDSTCNEKLLQNPQSPIKIPNKHLNEYSETLLDPKSEHEYNHKIENSKTHLKNKRKKHR